MPLLETKGAASSQGFGLTLGGAERVFIEDVFSTFPYTGNGSTQTITNGIDLSTHGGLVWTKRRSGALSHYLVTTSLGTSNYLSTDSTAAQGSTTTLLTPSTTGFDFSSNTLVNANTASQVAWTFRKQPKFFDCGTFTGDGAASKAISHNLGAVPGCVFVKRTDGAGGNWFVWHRSSSGTPNNDYLILNDVAAVASTTNAWSSNAFTATQFFVSNNLSTNINGAQYVYYTFAHDAGGFGLSGTDNVISCGSYTGNGTMTGPTVTVGWEPQWVLIKKTSLATNSDWYLMDSMRGMSVSSSTNATLYANLSNAEDVSQNNISPTATGFYPITNSSSLNGNGDTYIYIAIRRGPMRVPTSGTSVFAPIARTGTNAAGAITTVGFPPDLSVSADRTAVGRNPSWTDRLRGSTRTLYSTATNAEFTSSSTEDLTSFARMNGVDVGTWNQSVINAPSDIANWFFRRAPGFFDVVCYTGTGSPQVITHNLKATPEFAICKSRSLSGTFWRVYSAALGVSKNLNLNDSGAAGTVTNYWGNGSTITDTQFDVSPSSNSGETHVAYLFASCPGVSKVGSYTGTGATLQINCGFTGGARFVLIKRTDSTGDWYVWDTARGIVASTDPYLVLNSTAAEVTSTDWVDTYSAGFELSSAAGNNVNINAASYIFLSIA